MVLTQFCSRVVSVRTPTTSGLTFAIIWNISALSLTNEGMRGKLAKISAPDSNVEVWVVPTNEELLIARDTKALVESMK